MQNTKQESNLPPAVQLFEIATGFMKSQAVYAAARLGIADYLRDGHKSIDDLAKVTDTNRDNLYRLLRALASIGIFAEKSDGTFELTPLAAALLSDIPVSLRHYILLSYLHH